MAAHALSPDQEAEVRQIIETLPRRDRALLLLALHAGFRIRETLSIRIGDVWDGKAVRSTLRVDRHRLKGGAGVRRRKVFSRTVPLHPIAARAIRDYVQERLRGGPLDPAAPLFLSREGGKGISTMQASRIFRSVFARAGLTGPGYSTHVTRRTFAQKIYRASHHDIELTRAALGHSSILTTQKYLRASEEQAHEIILQLGAVIEPAA